MGKTFQLYHQGCALTRGMAGLFLGRHLIDHIDHLCTDAEEHEDHDDGEGDVENDSKSLNCFHNSFLSEWVMIIHYNLSDDRLHASLVILYRSVLCTSSIGSSHLPVYRFPVYDSRNFKDLIPAAADNSLYPISCSFTRGTRRSVRCLSSVTSVYQISPSWECMYPTISKSGTSCCRCIQYTLHSSRLHLLRSS